MTGRSAILVVCFDNLGDLVFTSALFPPLRATFPESRLGVWCKAYARPIAGLIPEVDEVFAADPFWDRAPGRGRGSLRRFARVLRSVAARDYDTALIVSRRWEAAAAARLAGIGERIGARGRRSRRWLTTCIPAVDRAKPALAELTRLLAALGIPPGPLVYRLLRPPPPPRLRTGRCVALHPFAGDGRRCVAPGVWVAFAERLAEAGWEILWFGTERELHGLRAGHAARLDRHAFADALTGGDLLGGATLIGAADAFVGHDSGPMHVAAALGVPTLGVFTPGEPFRTFPQGPGRSHILVRDSPLGVTAADLATAFEVVTAGAIRQPPPG
jgi:ADP-heptose:LPS heptosyltransferase